MKIKKQLVSNDVINKRSYGRGNPITSITIHQTGNYNKGANAQAHANLQSNLNPRQASWHIQIDDKQAIQSFPYDVKCWAVRSGKTNLKGGDHTSIHVELCVNSNGNYVKTIENGVKVVRKLLKQFNLNIKDVKRHIDWYNKSCPNEILQNKNGISWNDFINMVSDKPVENLRVDGYFGKLTISALQRYFGTIVDGHLSKPSMVIRALQTWLNKNGASLRIDGYFGTLTISALQRYFNTIVDGKLSSPSMVIKELQRRLNKGILEN